MRVLACIALLASTARADSIGITYSHQPSARVGAAPSVPIAKYGIQRTQRGKAVWRDSGCLAVEYDGSIDAATARVIDAAFASWSNGVQACGELSITTTRVANAPVGIDGVSTVRIRRDAWPYNPEAAAVTRLAFRDDPSSPDDGKILEADMEINLVDFAMLAPGAIASPNDPRPALYLQAVVTHEVGHMLGLAHACGTGVEDWPTDHTGAAVPSCDAPEAAHSTMFYAVGPIDDGPSTLESNDVTGACAIFREVACVAEVHGGCDAANSPSTWLGLALLGLRRRRKP